MKQMLLKMDSVAASYKGFEVLKDISLTMIRGEKLCIVGKNGSGKTLLVEILAGKRDAESGIIEKGDSRIAIIQQTERLIKSWSVAENIFLTDGRAVINSRKLNKNTFRLLEKYNIPLEPHQNLGEVSEGYKKIIEILKAKQSSANLLILDSVMDIFEDRELLVLRKVLDDMKQEGASILVLNQKYDDLFDSFDRLFILHEGRLAKVYFKGELAKSRHIDSCVENNAKLRKGLSRYKGRRVLTLRNINVEPLLQNMSFSVFGGDIVGVYNTNPKMNDVLLGILTGRRRDYGGSVFVNMKPVFIDSVSKAVASGIGFLLDYSGESPLFARMTPAQNMYLPILKKISWKGTVITNRMEQFISDECNAILGIEGSALALGDRSVDKSLELKLIMNKWVLKDSHVIVMNNPVMGADGKVKTELFNLMEQAAEMDKGILFITENLQDIMSICNRLIVVDDGRVVYDGNVEGYVNG